LLLYLLLPLLCICIPYRVLAFLIYNCLYLDLPFIIFWFPGSYCLLSSLISHILSLLHYCHLHFINYYVVSMIAYDQFISHIYHRFLSLDSL
jgi:hypothetical protein